MVIHLLDFVFIKNEPRQCFTKNKLSDTTSKNGVTSHDKVERQQTVIHWTRQTIYQPFSSHHQHPLTLLARSLDICMCCVGSTAFPVHQRILCAHYSKSGTKKLMQGGSFLHTIRQGILSSFTTAMPQQRKWSQGTTKQNISQFSSRRTKIRNAERWRDIVWWIQIQIKYQNEGQSETKFWMEPKDIIIYLTWLLAQMSMSDPRKKSTNLFTQERMRK